MSDLNLAHLDKFEKKYIRVAKLISEDNDSCYSERQVGAVIVKDNGIVSTGYNGAPAGCPHADHPDWLALICDGFNLPAKHGIDREIFIKQNAWKQQCPRRILGYKSGEGLELCPCTAHAERNAIYFAAKKGAALKGSSIFCWCAVPCSGCASGIIHAGISKVYCWKTDEADYDPTARFMLESAGIQLIFYDRDQFS